MGLADKDCVPATPGTPPISRSAMEPLLEELGLGWAVNQAGHLKCLYQFAGLQAGFEFCQRVGRWLKRLGIIQTFSLDGGGVALSCGPMTLVA